MLNLDLIGLKDGAFGSSGRCKLKLLATSLVGSILRVLAGEIRSLNLLPPRRFPLVLPYLFLLLLTLEETLKEGWPSNISSSIGLSVV